MIGRMAALNLPGIGSQTIRKAEKKAGILSDDLADFLGQAESLWGKGHRPKVLRQAWDLALIQVKMIESIGGRIVAQGDEGYPQGFMDLENPPLLMTLAGNPSLLQEMGIAVVGTREPSPCGRQAARRMGKECADRGRVTVSGLALGCDALAHQGALDAGGPTIAVLPSDLTRIVPGANRALAGRILSEGGLLISEIFPKTRLEPYHFVQRNRLIAALSEWIVVVEAGVESGTMHTVRMGRKLDKRIGLVDTSGPGSEGGRWILDHGWGLSFHQVDDLL